MEFVRTFSSIYIFPAQLASWQINREKFQIQSNSILAKFKKKKKTFKSVATHKQQEEIVLAMVVEAGKIDCVYQNVEAEKYKSFEVDFQVFHNLNFLKLNFFDRFSRVAIMTSISRLNLPLVIWLRMNIESRKARIRLC